MRAFAAILILLLIFNSCKDEDSLSVGTITGPDLRDCLCCGGYFIDIGKKTYRFYNEELPPGSLNFDLADVIFPLKVRVRWELKEDGCMGDEILITKFKVPN